MKDVLKHSYRVYFREDYMAHGEKDLLSNAVTLETELKGKHILYDALKLRTDDAIIKRPFTFAVAHNHRLYSARQTYVYIYIYIYTYIERE